MDSVGDPDTDIWTQYSWDKCGQPAGWPDYVCIRLLFVHRMKPFQTLFELEFDFIKKKKKKKSWILSKYLLNFGQKRVVTFPIIKNICLVRIHRHRLTNTRGLIWESSDCLWTRKCSRWIRDRVQALLHWNRRPGRALLLLFHPTSSYMKDFWVFFGLIFFFFFRYIISALKFDFYFAQCRARHSLWPSFSEFEWQSFHSAGTGARRRRLICGNEADCWFLDYHL